MPVNRNALIRYKTIDKCLQNRYRKWTLEDLIDACSDALYEYEGIDKGVSKRTVQADIQMMRSDKLGYNAPIVVLDKKYYTYEDAHYSITNIPVSEQDLSMLSEAVEFMKQFKGFSHFRELEGMIQKLEDHVYSHKTQTKPVIDFDKNENLKGLEFLNPLYQAIINKETVAITYQSFKARKAATFDFHGYVLKEYRNRWFIIGRKANHDTILNLALDRIITIKKSNLAYQEKDFDAKKYFADTIGVSVSATKEPEEVVLFINRHHAPYVLTKPIHPSQKLVATDPYGVTISMQVHQNFELEKEILAFGDAIQVLQPESLKRNIKAKLTNALDLYQTEITEKGLAAAVLKLYYKGSAQLNHIYTQREINNLGHHFHRISKGNMMTMDLIKSTPTLLNFIINRNIKKIVQKIESAAFLVQATYLHHGTATNTQWQQQRTIPVKEESQLSPNQQLELLENIFIIDIFLDDLTSDAGYFLLPGSHQKTHSIDDIQLITENSFPFTLELNSGGALVHKPLLLRRHQKIKTSEKQRIIRLTFSSKELPSQIEWKQQVSIR